MNENHRDAMRANIGLARPQNSRAAFAHRIACCDNVIDLETHMMLAALGVLLKKFVDR